MNNLTDVDNFTAILMFLEWCQEQEIELGEFDPHHDHAVLRKFFNQMRAERWTN